jgi:hypothetical protein
LTSPGLSRRDWLAASLALGLAPGHASSLPAPDSTPAPTPAGDQGSLPDFKDPAVNLRELVRMQGSLDEEDVPWWFTGVIFAVVGEEQPRPLVRFEGMEIYWFRHVPDGYVLGGNTVTFFRDYESWAWLSEFRNPWTGAVDVVKPAVQGGRVGFHYGVDGIRPAQQPATPGAPPLRLQWHALRDYVWLQNQTVYPPGMPPMHGQRQTMFVPREQFLDERIAALPTAFSSTVFMRWFRWMNMGERPGHLVWHASGIKLRSIAELPPEYRERAAKEFPERMTANPNPPARAAAP